MFGFPSVTFIQGESPVFENGIFIKLPPELQTPYLVNQYVTISGTGWSKTDLGYDCYSFYANEYTRISFVCLITTNNNTIKKKFKGYNAAIIASDVEREASRLQLLFNRYNEETKSTTNSLIHDIRSISREILHAAVDGAARLADNQIGAAKIRFGNLEALQSLLKLRVDAFDFIDGEAEDDGRDDTPVFKAVDKVCRAVRPHAEAKGIRTNLGGASLLIASLPSHFMIAPYLIIENAIKYSPTNEDVSVYVYDADKRIIVTIESYGPRIYTDEYRSIFCKGYRGRSARGTGNEGSGLGLYVVSKIVTACGAVCNVEQDENDNIRKEFFKTRFRIEIPLSG